MIQPSLNSLNKALSDTLKSSNSELCWREFLVCVSYFSDHCSSNISEEEIADITKSLFNWTQRKNYIKYKVKDLTTRQFVEGMINPGDIFLVDLGINYKPECSYAHPALVLEEVDNMVAIIPTSSNTDKINEAYDPIKNPTGKWYYKTVDNTNGFGCTCVLMLNNLKVISKGRLLDYKGHLNEDINRPDSLYVEIKNTLFKRLLPKQFISYQKLLQENDQLKKELEALRNEKNKT